MTRNLDIGLLRAFAAVADAAGMTAASRVLHLTQGAVSQRIARLEALAGVPLVVRDRRGLRLTASGRRLLGKARELLALNDEIWAEIRGGAVAGPVRLGVPFDLVNTCLAPALRSFAGACPNVELSLHCGSSGDLGTRLALGQLDLAVLEQPLTAASGECLAVDRLVWVGARGGAARTRTPLPVSMVADTCAFGPAVSSALRRCGRDWRTVFENGSLDATLATVRMDLAVSVWLGSTVPAELDLLPVGSGLPALPTFAITLHGRDRPPTPAASELARHIRQATAQLGLPDRPEVRTLPRPTSSSVRSVGPCT